MIGRENDSSRIDAVVKKLASSVGSEDKARKAVEKVFVDLASQYSRAEIVTALENDVGAAA